MTAIYYPDQWARSKNKRWMLEAVSPHNGGIPHRNGLPATDDEYSFKYKDHQSDFRYRLIHVGGASGRNLSNYSGHRIAWERWQHARENSPHEVLDARSHRFLQSRSGKHSKGVQWWQNWEYDRRIDNRWETFRLTFCQETDGYKITERMRIDPYWQITDERVARYLYL